MRGKPVVVDASVVVKWLVSEDYSREASKLRDDHLEGRVEANAPDLLLLETASAFRKYAARGLISEGDALEALSLIGETELRLHSIDRQLALEALRLSLELGVTVYDAAYIALALKLKAPMYTADEALLANKQVTSLGLVTHVKDYPSHGPRSKE